MSTALFAVPARLVRTVALLGALALALALLALPAGAQDAQDVTAARVAGEGRVATAAHLASLTHEQADVAHLVSGREFADALAASYGAGRAAGPVLLAAAADDVGTVTWAALEELDVQEVRLVGGDATLDPAIEQQLADRGYEVRRIAGADRYATSAEVAKAYGLGPGDPTGTVDGLDTAVMASGATFADALTAGPIAADLSLPLVLTPPTRSDAAVEHALDLLHIDKILLIGGDAAVSPAVAQHYRNLGYDVERIAGPDRYGTAAALADQALLRFGFSPDTVLLARGDNHADALAAAPHGAALDAPILLTPPAQLSPHTADWFARACPAVDAVRALGGDAAVSEHALAQAVAAAQACEDDGVELVGQPSTAERESDAFPSGEFTDLLDVRAAVHDGFDRIVLETAGTERPAWSVTWTDEPRLLPAGEPADVEGEAFLEISLTASDEWGEGDTYPGPDRIAVDGHVVNEVYKTSDFEGRTVWTVGLEQTAPFAVDLHEDPTRLIVDVVGQ